MDLLRFFTAGNVDDGKSTLIGRLLLDSDSISTDIIEVLTKQSKNTNANTPIDLALLTDGLRAEREQGITIDVAYKFFSSKSRKYIIADTPGHAEYTRNMFTGASTCDLAIILIDARWGVTEQTKRHTIIASILGIPNLLVCVNKMDLVDYQENVFNQIKQDFLTFSSSLFCPLVNFIPMSALRGENVVHSCKKMGWYNGQTLFEFLENLALDNSTKSNPSRFQVQYIIRPETEELKDYLGFAGAVLSGGFSLNDEVFIYPSEEKSRIVRIEKNHHDAGNALEGDSIIFHLDNNPEIHRGFTLVKSEERPSFSDAIEAIICWMDDIPFDKDQELMLQHHSLFMKVSIQKINASISVQNAKELAPNKTIVLNEICKVSLKLSSRIAYDTYQSNQKFGAFLIIDKNSNNTVAAGVILEPQAPENVKVKKNYSN